MPLPKPLRGSVIRITAMDLTRSTECPELPRHNKLELVLLETSLPGWDRFLADSVMFILADVT